MYNKHSKNINSRSIEDKCTVGKITGVPILGKPNEPTKDTTKTEQTVKRLDLGSK